MRLGYISVPEPKRIDNDSLMANHLSRKDNHFSELVQYDFVKGY